jgi:hypothetical protein
LHFICLCNTSCIQAIAAGIDPEELDISVEEDDDDDDDEDDDVDDEDDGLLDALEGSSSEYETDEEAVGE